MDTLTVLSTWLGAMGTFLSSIVALFQLSAQMRKGHTSRTGFWIVTGVFLISVPLTAYGGYSLYQQYQRAYTDAVRMSKIGTFAPDFAPAQLNELGENSLRNISISEGDLTIPDPLSWYAVTPPTPIAESTESAANTPQQLKNTQPLQINYPKNRGYLYYQSTINRNKWGWSAIALARLTPIDLASRLKLIIVLNTSADDILELKLRDSHGSVGIVYMPIKRGWAAYVIELNNDGFSDVNLSRVQVLQFAHATHLSNHNVATFMVPLVVTAR
jgi:hypothetical protein